MNYLDDSILKEVYQPRSENARKYDYGYLLVIGGSQLYTGSPALSAMAAMRAGVDLTLVIAPERAADIIASFSPNLITYSLECHDLGEKHLPTLFTLTESAKRISGEKAAVVIGGGIGRDQETQKLVNDYLAKIDLPAVIDADALYAVSRRYDPIPRADIFQNKNFLLTPHAYEFFILSGVDVSNLTLEEKSEAVKNFAKKENVTVLLKGNTDIISDGKEVFLNKTGCPEMAVGGTGDVLAGICGCFLAQNIKPVLAASAAAYLNGRAGEKAKEYFGVGLTATDVIDCITKIIQK